MDMDEVLYPEDVLQTTEVDVPSTINPLMLGLDGTNSFPQLPQDSPQLTFTGEFSPSPSPSHAFRSSPPITVDRARTNAASAAFSSSIFPPRYPPLPHSTMRSGLVYSSTMRLHAEAGADPLDLHPEDPRRIASIFQELVDAGLANKEEKVDIEDMMLRIPIRYASEEELCLVHTPEHVEIVKSTEGMDIDRLKHEATSRDSVYFNNNTWLCAQMSAGGAIEATRAVVSGKVKNAFAIIRPPGHHAEPHEPSGFCMFNNVPVAARVVQKEFPETCRKILILDWDVHHGNGIQSAFYDDPNVLYISLHVYQDEHGNRFYPPTNWGGPENCGRGIGRGKNVNIAWMAHGMTDADYVFAFQQVVMPIAIEFDPDLVMISAGFDAADGDPLGQCFVSPAGYGHMTHMLMQLAKGKVVACLEGGYNLRAISKSSLAMTRVLMGEPPDRLTSTIPTQVGVKSVQTVMRIQSRFWKCMYPKTRDAQLRKEMGSERLHDVIREWQSGRLWKEHKMSQLFILRQKLSKSFDNQVLATPNYHEERPLLVIFHDPPEALGHPDVRSNQLELHNTWLTDVSKSYVDWAIAHNFAVIDVNIPKHLTDLEDPTAPASTSSINTTTHADSDPEALRAAATREVALYLWRNYIETSDCTHVFLLGTGDAYSGIVQLLSDYPTAAEMADHVFGFVANTPLRPLANTTDLETISHFKKNSSVYVSHTHSALDPARTKQIKHRHGLVLRSPEEQLQEMLHRHHKAVTEKMEALTAEWQAEYAARMAKSPGGGGAAARSGNGVLTPVEEDDELRVLNVGPGGLLSASSLVNGPLMRRAGEMSFEEGNVAKRARN